MKGDDLIVAVHTDFVADVVETQRNGGTAAMTHHHAAALRRGGINCICEHVVGDTFEALCFPTDALRRAYDPTRSFAPSALKHGLNLLASFLRDLEQATSVFGVATTAADIVSLAADGKIAVVLCFQGVTPLEDSPELLDVFYRLGLRILGITTNTDNAAGRSLLGRPGGLTEFGRSLVRRAAEKNMLVDVAHLSERGIDDVLELVGGPVIASNSNARRILDIPRNLSDTMIRSIAESGGIVGVHANGSLVTRERPVTLDHLIDHIAHVAELVGVDHVAVGPDIVDDSMYPAAAYRSLFADEPHFHATYPTGLQSHADLPNLVALLRRRGFHDGEVAKIMGGNALRVFREAWGA